jgi:hypothetical protein
MDALTTAFLVVAYLAPVLLFFAAMTALSAWLETKSINRRVKR